MKATTTKLELNASLARILLAVTLVLLLGAMAGGFYTAYGFMKTVASDVAQVQSEAKATDTKVQNVLLLEGKLDKHKDSVKKAEQIVAESTSYQYQNQVITDISAYAQQAGVGISSFSFQDTTAKPGASSSSGSTSASSASPAGAKSTSVSVQMAKDLDYTRFLNFLHLLEQNLTRMQVANISVTKGEGRGTVQSQALKLELYLR